MNSFSPGSDAIPAEGCIWERAWYFYIHFVLEIFFIRTDIFEVTSYIVNTLKYVFTLFKHFVQTFFFVSGDLVCRAMHYQQSRQQPPSNMNHKPCITWSPTALHSLFYYMKCCQLEYSDNPNVDPPAMQLNPER